MKLKTLMAALVVAFAPTLGLAQSCDHSERTASSCVEGYIWDNDAQSCVAVVSG